MRALPALVLGLAASLAHADHFDDLGSSKYKTREEATKALRENLTPETVQKLEKLLDHESLEVATRAKQLLRPYYQKKIADEIAKIKDECKGVFPWIDMLPEDYPERWCVQSNYMGGLPHGPDDGPPKWKRYSDATELLINNLPIDQVRPLVERMREKQRDWIMKYGKPYNLEP